MKLTTAGAERAGAAAGPDRAGAARPVGRHVWLARLVCVLAAVAVAAFFCPGILSGDSLDQIHQARDGQYHDWHPPLPAIVLGLVLRCGGDVWVLTLLQSVVGLLGVRELAAAVLVRRAARGDGRACGPGAQAWLATGIALTLLVPLSPLAFYLVTFWKDVWLAIAFVWIGALGLRLADTANKRGAGFFWCAVGLLTLLMALTLLLRHNALIVLPVFWLLGWAILRGHGVRWGWLWALTPVVLLAPLADWGLHAAAHVRRTHPFNHVMALDLVGLYVLEPDARATLPYTAANLTAPDYAQRYEFGSVVPLVWDEHPLVDPAYVRGDAPNAALRSEYVRAWRTYPGSLAAVKWRAFVPLLGLRRTTYWVHSPNNGLDPNNLGLAPPARLHAARQTVLKWADRVAGQRYGRWIGGVHGLWLGVALWAAAAAAVRWRRGHGQAAGSECVLLLMPLAYYAGHLLASVALDFRYLYPATLFVQTYAAAAVLAAVSASRRAARGVRCS